MFLAESVVVTVVTSQKIGIGISDADIYDIKVPTTALILGGVSSVLIEWKTPTMLPNHLVNSKRIVIICNKYKRLVTNQLILTNKY